MFRKTIQHTLAAAWYFLATAFPVAATESPDSSKTMVRFATDLIEPYQMLNEQGELEGTATAVIKCVMTAMNNAYSIDLVPWARAQKNVELGEHDAFFIASRNATRDAYATSSDPIFKGKRSWVLKPGLEANPNSEEFEQKHRVGAVFGTNMHAWLNEKYSHVVTRTDEISLLELLLAGRISALLITDAMYQYVIQKHGIKDQELTTLDAPNHPLGVYFGHRFLARNIGFIERFNAALPACRPDNIE